MVKLLINDFGISLKDYKLALSYMELPLRSGNFYVIISSNLKFKRFI